MLIYIGCVLDTFPQSRADDSSRLKIQLFIIKKISVLAIGIDDSVRIIIIINA